jgi:hypothetical protein
MATKIKQVITLFLLLALTVSCSKVKEKAKETIQSVITPNAGTWEDDLKNWKRIYNYEKPDFIKIIHSRYWQSPHWTLEYEFYIETDSCQQILDSFLSQADIELIKDTTEVRISKDKPQWFVPNSLDRYNIWKGTRHPVDNFFLFIDKENGHLYWHELQL